MSIDGESDTGEEDMQASKLRLIIFVFYGEGSDQTVIIYIATGSDEVR